MQLIAYGAQILPHYREPRVTPHLWVAFRTACKRHNTRAIRHILDQEDAYVIEEYVEFALKSGGADVILAVVDSQSVDLFRMVDYLEVAKFLLEGGLGSVLPARVINKCLVTLCMYPETDCTIRLLTDFYPWRVPYVENGTEEHLVKMLGECTEIHNYRLTEYLLQFLRGPIPSGRVEIHDLKMLNIFRQRRITVDLSDISIDMSDLSVDDYVMLHGTTLTTTECPICLDTLPCMKTPCGHRLCVTCHRTWFSSNQTCPVCRQTMTCRLVS